MPRNTSGVYTLPAGNPVSPATIIESAWANITLADVANEVTNSLDRSGRGSMLAAFKAMDGTQAQPGITFGTEPASGFYRNGANDIRMAVAGADTMRWTPTGVVVPGTLTVGGAMTFSGATTFSALMTVNANIVQAGTHTITYPNAGGLQVLSGAAGSWAGITIGRTVAEGYAAISGGPGNIVAGDVAGDFSFRVNGGRYIWGIGSTFAMTLDTSQNLGLGGQAPGLGGTGPILNLFHASTQPAITLHNATSGNTASRGAMVRLNALNLEIQNFEAAGFVTVSVAGSERARFDANGYLGVGGTPVYRIHAVGGGSSPVIAATSTDPTGVNVYMQANSNVDGRLGTISNHPCGIYVNSVERFRLGTAANFSLQRLEGSGTGDEGFRNIGNSAYYSFYSAGSAARTGYLQITNTGVASLVNEVAGAGTTLNLSVNGASRLVIDGAGRIQIPFSHNNPSGLAGAAYIGSGDYTPAPSALVNCSVNSVQIHQFLRDGNVVTVSGAILVNTVAAGLVQVTYAPPIPSTWSSPSRCAGSLTASISGGAFPGFIQGVSGNVVLNFYTSGAALHTLTYSFTYTVA